MPKTYKMNLVKLVEHFHSEEKCRAYLEHLRWPDGVACPRCSAKNVSRIEKRNQFHCNSCRHQFSVTSGTIFHDSHLPLWKWFLTAYMMIESRKGVSANQIKRTVGVSYKTAWYLCHRIRAAIVATNPAPLSGTVEVDETWVGGKRRGMGRGYTDNKTMVLGVIERGGEVRLKVAKHADRETLHGFIRLHTSPETQRIITDEWPAYKGIDDHDTRHETVNHKAKEWVRGDVHTNTVENVWSLFNRSIVGAYHKVSTKHLDAYLDELEWRFNNRQNPYLFRETLRKLLAAQSLPYARLTNGLALAEVIHRSAQQPPAPTP